MKSFHPLKGGGGGCKKFYTVLRGGAQKVSHFVAPHPVINDQSLSQMRLPIDRSSRLSQIISLLALCTIDVRSQTGIVCKEITSLLSSNRL